MVEQQQLFVLGQGRQAVRVLFYISAVKRTFRWPDGSAARRNVHFLYYSYFHPDHPDRFDQALWHRGFRRQGGMN
jgi:hypothetical protein